jgi:hypothetical protein
MRASMALVRLLLTTLFMILQAPQAGAQIGAPELIDVPVPAKWRAPFTQFLKEFGIVDAEATVDASRVGLHDEPMVGRPESIVFRVIHPWACASDRDKCLTIVGHIEQDKLVADLMFSAGDRITRGDTFPHVLGINGMPPIYFLSRDATVVVINTAMGFVIFQEPGSPPWRK